MKKIDDMALFVQVVRSAGLAAAGRKLGLSPSSMTARLNRIEKRYETRFFTRNTRSLALTDSGVEFYNSCLNVIDEIENIENIFLNKKKELRGNIRISATSDFGKNYIAPAVAEFTNLHPNVLIHLNISDGLVNIIDQNIDIAYRLGNLQDSDFISRHLYKNRRVLCVSPIYINKKGMPKHPDELCNHQCLILERDDKPMNEWFFEVEGKKFSKKITAYMSCSDGEIIKKWALVGQGIAFKSLIDIRQELASGKLIEVFEDYFRGCTARDNQSVNLQAIYPSKKYQQIQVKEFLIFFDDWFKSKWVE